MNDFEFDMPSEIASEFASADSFRGRLVLIQVTGYERDIPSNFISGKFDDRVTATVTTVDGKGPVQIFSHKAPTGKFLEGPVHEGVWFGQDRLVKALAPQKEANIGRKVLAVMETYKPGKAAGLGNPWGLTHPTPEQITQAKTFLADMMVSPAVPAPAPASSYVPPKDDPFAAR